MSFASVTGPGLAPKRFISVMPALVSAHSAPALGGPLRLHGTEVPVFQLLFDVVGGADGEVLETMEPAPLRPIF